MTSLDLHAGDVISVALVAATFMLWFATRKLVSSAERTAQRQLRAYIGVEAGAFVKDGDKPLTLSVSLRNHGQTPATDLTFVVSRRLLPMELPADYIFVDDNAPGQPPKVVMHPSSTIDGHPDEDVNPITNADWGAFVRGENAAGVLVGIYLYGTVRYYDVFRKRHWTNFAFRWEKGHIGEIDPRGFGRAFVTTCAIHNDIGTYDD